ncbi:uncharacterized protein LOC117182657 [Belonocnema kinseyi]|uniref:uncharacterized protein LOC117182657 n=1 Tax=Belonocnema kinseyi TaxID=2817044 RepID=UPI00143DC06F|nr:uncharacterized protein LOC117182657 [Belonocnema kinseyi]
MSLREPTTSSALGQARFNIAGGLPHPQLPEMNKRLLLKCAQCKSEFSAKDSLTHLCVGSFKVKQPPINETPQEKLVRREEEEKMRKEEIERAMQKEIKKIRDRKLIEERFEMYNEYGSRRGDPRIIKLAEEKRIFYNLPTI